MFCFVVGSGCCGSSLVQEILARHPSVGFLSNVDDLLAPLRIKGRANSAAYRVVPQRWTMKGRARFAPSEGYRVLSREVSPVIAHPGRALTETDAEPWLAGRFRCFFETRSRAQGQPVFLHKFTGHCRAGFIEASMPGSRFIHIVRDGRAVANSLLHQGWWVGEQGRSQSWSIGGLLPSDHDAWVENGRSDALLAGLAWKSMMADHELARKALPGSQWLQLRYEDVLADPLPAFTEMLKHMGLSMDERFRAVVDSYRLNSGRAAGFRSELSPRSLDLLDARLATQLSALGYEVSGPRT